MTAARMTLAEWEHLHPDFRAGDPRDGSAKVLEYVPGVGTCLVPVEVVTFEDAYCGHVAAMFDRLFGGATEADDEDAPRCGGSGEHHLCGTPPGPFHVNCWDRPCEGCADCGRS